MQRVSVLPRFSWFAESPPPSQLKVSTCVYWKYLEVQTLEGSEGPSKKHSSVPAFVFFRAGGCCAGICASCSLNGSGSLVGNRLLIFVDLPALNPKFCLMLSKSIVN